MVKHSYKEFSMNKSDLIDAFAEKKNLTEKQAMEIVDLMFKGFINELKNGGRKQYFKKCPTYMTTIM